MLDVVTMRQFTGTECYYRLWGNVVLTEGTRYVALNAGKYGACWLMTDIASYQFGLLKNEPFQAWKLTLQEGGGAMLTATDGDERELVRQEYQSVDFDPAGITLYVESGGLTPESPELRVILLPDEH